MRHQKTAVMLSVHVVRQQWVYNVHSKVLPVEPGVHLLLRGNDLINSGIEAVCIRWNGNQRLVIDAAKRGGQIRQWIVSIQQRRSEGADIRNGKVRIRLHGRGISQHRMAACSARKRGRELTQVSRPLERRRHGVLLRLRGPSPVALIVEEEERLVVTVIKVWNQHWSSNAATKGIEMLWRLLCKIEDASIERIVLQILEERAMKSVRSALARERYVTHLGELGIVVKRRNLELRNSFRRGIRVGACGTIEDIRG